MIKSKIRVGIDINEVLRAKWLQFDRFYAQEFGEEGIPENPYVYDFFKHYKWEDTIEIIKVLKEPEDMPENINPLDYQIDNENGEAPADFVLFKSPEEVKLTAREMYNRFMYEDFAYEIFACSPIMYKGMDLHLKHFYEKYKDTVEFTILSVENQFSIPSTLFFLSKMTSRFSNYRFVDESSKMLDNIDILITTDPAIIQKKEPFGKKIIKLTRPYNKDLTNCSLEVLQVADLMNNPKFEKIIKYKKPE